MICAGAELLVSCFLQYFMFQRLCAQAQGRSQGGARQGLNPEPFSGVSLSSLDQ